MLKALPVVVAVALFVYCLIDSIQADESRVRNLPRLLWMVVIVAVPVVGPVAWLVAGRPLWQPPWHATQEPTRPLAPDDDPDFLASIHASDTRHEEMLAEWEAQLRERERRLREHESDDPPDLGR
ncbi:MAG: PLDc N-terminal domain-containing protein [Micrococcales bacterium]|nr:PLDc N-terminal domain-containing protein [Micrococcales bacterium]